MLKTKNGRSDSKNRSANRGRESRMLESKNDLAESTRAKVVELLQARLADAIDLSTQAKQAHWNIRGPHFIGLHELFDKVYAEVVTHVDEIAERAGQLGSLVQGTARTVARQTSLTEYPIDITDGPDHVDALSTRLAEFGKAVREAIDQSDELGDADTADLFTEISRGIDKMLWFVEAHLQAER